MGRRYKNYQAKKRSFNRYNGRSSYAGRRIKTFNPTELINNPQIVEEKEEYKILHSFSDFKISSELRKNILDKGYKDPTPIQDQVIEPILEGKDLVGVANTGTGKTAAFLIPLVNKVLEDRYNKVLILAPTRELAFQIRDELISFTRYLKIYSSLCIGGEKINKQFRELSRNPNFVIATPGRMLDLIRSRKIDLRDFSSVVLDEADRMVDIGFIKDIKYIISLLPQNRQSLFFSATINKDVKQILETFVKNPVTVSVKQKDIIENITQQVVDVWKVGTKFDTLFKLLTREEFSKVLVFGRTKHGVQKLSDELSYKGLKSVAIHGNKNQSQRIKALARFKRDEVQVLVATDVASRGLDIPNVSHVINYDLPESYEVYIHRIGRTGRADKKGVALTFIN